jgi:hypothetical protein
MNHAFTSTSSCDVIGYIASALVLATFSMQSMRSLRVTAIASNMAFIAYAAYGHLPPILILHSILLPLNIVRLMQIDRNLIWLRKLVGLEVRSL